jgi:hypothetical protein
MTHINNNDNVKDRTSETFEDSNMLILCDGHIKLSRYIFTTISNTNRSLNKKPVNITNFLINKSADFFCKKSIIRPSFQTNSFRL